MHCKPYINYKHVLFRLTIFVLISHFKYKSRERERTIKVPEGRVASIHDSKVSLEETAEWPDDPFEWTIFRREDH